MRCLIKHLINCLPISQASQLIQNIDIDPAFGLAGNDRGIIVRRQVLEVLCLGIQFVVSDCAFLIHIGNHAARLSEESPGIWLNKHEGFLPTNMVRDGSLARHNWPPVILIGRVCIGNHAIPCRSAVLHRGETANAHGAGIDNLLGHFARFVDPDTGKFKREKLLHIFRPVEGQEDYLHIKIALLDVVGIRRRMPKHLAPDVFWEPI